MPLRPSCQAIPIIYGSQSTCEAMKTFFYYNKNSTLLDASKLKRVNAGALEDCRRAMVWAMKLGTTLCIYCGALAAAGTVIWAMGDSNLKPY